MGNMLDLFHGFMGASSVVDNFVSARKRRERELRILLASSLDSYLRI